MATAIEEGTNNGWKPARILAVLVVLALVLFWIWIFAGGPAKDNPDLLGDRGWTARAEGTCSATRAEIDRLPRASQANDADARADGLDRATEALATMVGLLTQPGPDDATDARLVRAWLTDWRAYLVNRREYATALRRDPQARLLVDEKFDDPIDTVIKTFAEVNDMASCAPPGDAA